MNLESPHNNEQCVCADITQLENASLKDCAFMFKQFATDIDNVHKYLRAAGREAIESTLKYRNAQAYDRDWETFSSCVMSAQTHCS